MSEKLLRKILAKIKEVEKAHSEWLSYHERRNFEIEAWRYVVKEAKKEAKKQ